MSYRYRVATVFGGSGFLGRHLIHRLAKTGAVIRVATRHPDACGFLKTAGAVGQIVPLPVDIRDPRAVAAAVQDADTVVNLVGVLYESRPGQFHALHVEGARHIAKAARAAGAERLLHVSALGADPASRSAYARTKALGEQAVLAEFPDATILRPSVVFGPEDGFFNRFAAMTLYSPVLPLIGGGTTRFQPVYVGDVAEAMMAALKTPATKGRIYELAGPRVYTFRQLMELLLAEIGRRRLLVPIPWRLAEILGRVLQLLPKPPLTRDQVEQLKTDNVPGPGAPGLSDLGITPTAVELILPTYMDRFRLGGRFARRHQFS